MAQFACLSRYISKTKSLTQKLIQNLLTNFLCSIRITKNTFWVYKHFKNVVSECECSEVSEYFLMFLSFSSLSLSPLSYLFIIFLLLFTSTTLCLSNTSVLLTLKHSYKEFLFSINSGTTQPTCRVLKSSDEETGLNHPAKCNIIWHL